MEYVIYGYAPETDNSNPLNEELLISENAEIESMAHAKRVVEKLESLGCTKCRIVKFNWEKPNFTQTINN